MPLYPTYLLCHLHTACTSQLNSIVRVSQDFHESVPIVQDCEVCAPVPLSTSSSESKGTSIITLIVLLCLFIELVTHLLQLPADSTDYNKTHLLYSTHLSESASITKAVYLSVLLLEQHFEKIIVTTAIVIGQIFIILSNIS